ncbi:MAG: ABC transporter ATP-binding protein/permease [Alphaproteobacteria bacterium]|nr:ABC transporter ATP-binding protein/permease [Alphaproteobacteria bacterium]
MAEKLTKELKKLILENMFVKNYKRMWPYVKPYWFRSLLSVLITIPLGSMDALIALVLKPYMDLVMIEKSIETAWYIPLVIIAFTSVQGGLTYISAYLNTWVGTKITNLLKLDLYKKMLTFETEYFNKRNSGDVIFTFNNNADMACSGLISNLKSFLEKFFKAISLIAVLFYNSWQLAIVCSLVLVGAFLPMSTLRKKVNSVMSQSIAADSALLTAYNESYAGNKTVISYNLDCHQQDKFKCVLNNVFNLRLKMLKRTRWITPIMHIVLSIGIGLAIWFGSMLILDGTITAGNFVSFLTALILLYTPMKSIGNNYNSLLMSFLAIERVFDVLDSTPAIVDRKDAKQMPNTHNKIEFSHVSFRYLPDVPVLKDINFSVNHGETIALVGNSGGGKTTVVNLLPRFYDVTEGGIYIDGTDIRDFTMKSLRQNIGVVFQDNFLFAGTIRENILLGNENATQEEIDKAVEMAYLDDFVKTLKNGLDTQIGERGIMLSGGQKQRVAIARAFLKNAPILILDEATSALDNKAEAVVQKAIENLMRDKTVFVIAHRLSTVRNATKIVVINEGQIVEAGTHDELIKIENGAYKALYDMQFKTNNNK